MVTKKDKKLKYLIGIDEAGRGALAGPVAVGCVMWKLEDWPKIKQELKDYPMGKDSKKLTPKQRDLWFGRIEELEKKSLLNFKCAFSSNRVIDKKGINWAIKKGIKKCLCDIQSQGSPRLDIAQASSQTFVLLDGGLKAPPEWKNQETIIKGDEKELIISLASIVAKVSRDREMVKLNVKYPQYCLDCHKGYGTKLHYKKIEVFGCLVIHRQTYLKNLAKK